MDRVAYILNLTIEIRKHLFTESNRCTLNSHTLQNSKLNSHWKTTTPS